MTHETKHTAGPWVTDGYNRITSKKHQYDESGKFIAETKSWETGETEALANARLIAAAPELLEVLVSVRKGVSPDMDTRDCEYLRGIIDAAISKAKPCK